MPRPALTLLSLALLALPPAAQETRPRPDRPGRQERAERADPPGRREARPLDRQALRERLRARLDARRGQDARRGRDLRRGPPLPRAHELRRRLLDLLFHPERRRALRDRIGHGLRAHPGLRERPRERLRERLRDHRKARPRVRRT